MDEEGGPGCIDRSPHCPAWFTHRTPSLLHPPEGWENGGNGGELFPGNTGGTVGERWNGHVIGRAEGGCGGVAVASPGLLYGEVAIRDEDL